MFFAKYFFMHLPKWINPYIKNGQKYISNPNIRQSSPLSWDYVGKVPIEHIKLINGSVGPI